MKCFKTSLLSLLLSFFAVSMNAAVWQVAAPADLYLTYNDAAFVSGDVIELTTDGGAYTWGTKLNTTQKSFTVKSAAGLLNRPVITCPTLTTAAALFSANSSTAYTPNFVFDGVEFVGTSNITAFVVAGKTTVGGTFSVNVNNCKFSGFSKSDFVYFQYANSYSADPTKVITQNFGDLTVRNSIFIGAQSVVAAGTVTGANHFNVPNNMIFENNYFKSILNNAINNNLATVLSNSLLINHCTFDGCATTNKEVSVGNNGTSGAPTVIKNTLFANRGASTTANIFGAVGTEANANNAVYYTGAGVNTTIYPIATLSDYVTQGFTVDPVIDAATYIATASVYQSAGTDSKTIGFVGANGFTTGVDKSVLASAGALTVAQNGKSFRVNVQNAPYSVYALSGVQVAKGLVANGQIDLNLNKGVYVLKVNNKVAKFVVR